MKPGPYNLGDFAHESNAIEGIFDDQRDREHANALAVLLACPRVSMTVLEEFVRAIEPGAFLRTAPHHAVRVGNHYPPSATIAQFQLRVLLDKIADNVLVPRYAHCEYERIHPFIDGNGRSGRALWLWMMQERGWDVDRMPRLFLQSFYYQTLEAHR